ncbi:hypothetical protein CVS40_3502 [Lucilia cuprina]|nr:hypothetical protein CVS40_3502 [Lucilia cuprina]
MCMFKTELKIEISTVKTEVIDIKTAMQEFAKLMNQNQAQMNSNLKTAVATITNSISTLTTQVSTFNTRVSHLCESNKEKEKQINEMKNQINDLQQQLLNKTIEIKNITKEHVNPNDVIKTIGKSLNVEINDHDNSNSYILKKSKRVIVEFTSLNKKKELFSKINRHRVDSTLVNDDTNNKFIYINEYLTPHKRQLLRLAKTKGK